MEKQVTKAELASVKDTRAIERLAERRKNPPKQIDNNLLWAGSPIYFYCRLCGYESDRLPESYMCAPKQYCHECDDLKNTTSLTDQTLIELAENKA